MNKNPVAAAIEAVGGQRELAEAVGVHRSLVSQWATGRRPVAAKHAIPIETVTGGVVTRHDLRPEVFGPAPGAHVEAG